MDAERGEGVGKRLPSSNLYGYSRMKYCETDILANLNVRVAYFSSSGWWIELQKRSYGK